VLGGSNKGAGAAGLLLCASAGEQRSIGSTAVVKMAALKSMMLWFSSSLIQAPEITKKAHKALALRS
jgi:hypothetical protein